MKRYVFLLLSLLLLSACKTQHIRKNPFTLYTATDYLGAKGKVWNVLIYNVKNTDNQYSEELSQNYLFSPEGYITKIILYNEGEEYCTFTYDYDAQGRVLEEHAIYKNSDISPTKKVYSYHRKNTFVREKRFSKEIPEETVERRYNKEYQQVSETLYDHRGKMLNAIRYHYDKQGRTTKMEFYDSKNALTRSNLLRKDDKGRVLESITYDKAGEEKSKITFTYNASGDVATQKMEDRQPKPKIIERTIMYEYDAHQNYTQQTYFEGDKPIYEIKRVITYYPEE